MLTVSRRLPAYGRISAEVAAHEITVAAWPPG
jgi:hypothetical protein